MKTEYPTSLYSVSSQGEWIETNKGYEARLMLTEPGAINQTFSREVLTCFSGHLTQEIAAMHKRSDFKSEFAKHFLIGANEELLKNIDNTLRAHPDFVMS